MLARVQWMQCRDCLRLWLLVAFRDVGGMSIRYDICESHMPCGKDGANGACACAVGARAGPRPAPTATRACSHPLLSSSASSLVCVCRRTRSSMSRPRARTCGNKPKRKLTTRTTVRSGSHLSRAVADTDAHTCSDGALSHNTKQFKPPVLSLRNAVLFSDAYSKVVDAALDAAPTLAEGRDFELRTLEFLSPHADPVRSLAASTPHSAGAPHAQQARAAAPNQKRKKLTAIRRRGTGRRHRCAPLAECRRALLSVPRRVVCAALCRAPQRHCRHRR